MSNFKSLPWTNKLVIRLFGIAYLILWPIRLVIMLTAAPLFLLFLGIDWLMRVCFVNYFGPGVMLGGSWLSR